jgi:putative acetyltransferase
MEAELVERLRASGVEQVALVAEHEGRVAAHVLFTPVVLEGAAHGPRPLAAWGLAPLAVDPAAQRRGLGTALVRAGLAALRARGAALVVVLGDPAYYARFGFADAARSGLRCEFAAPEGAFQALWLGPEPPAAGRVRYHAAFEACA